MAKTAADILIETIQDWGGKNHEQAAKFAQSLARGEPNRSRIGWTVLSDKVREMI
jgi:hypothetical protein